MSARAILFAGLFLAIIAGLTTFQWASSLGPQKPSCRDGYVYLARSFDDYVCVPGYVP